MMRLTVALLMSWALLGCTESETAQAADSVETTYNQGVEAYRAKDYAKAFAHWTHAAAYGEVNALNNLGFLLYNGHGVETNHAAAIKLWRTASFAGHAESQWHLAAAYESGVGVEQDPAKAYAWYRCSIVSAGREIQADQEDDAASIVLDDARKSIGKLAPTLSEAELKRAEALATEYTSRYAQAAP